MLKKSHSQINPKQNSKKSNYLGPLSSGLNRRAFLKTTTAISLLGGLAACKPSIPQVEVDSKAEASQQQSTNFEYFNAHQKTTLDAVQMQLFPADNNGPSARDLNAINYLEWAMSDPQNNDDGDPQFIANGIGWLDDLAEQTQGDIFIKLSVEQQDKVLRQIANSRAGENWLSMLLYYLSEALCLDPVYGGNPEQIGWQWLQHQPGFPRPIAGKTYRDFE